MKAGYIIGVIIVILGLGLGSYVYFRTTPHVLSPIEKIIERPLDKYTIDALSNRTYEGSEIIFDEIVATTSAYTVSVFHFMSDGPTSPARAGYGGARKKVTGLAHTPVGKGPFPVIIQFRGYVDPENYQPGVGTKRSAEVFAKNGFISLAPDFLGYGGSANPSADVFEERFQNYVTALNLLASIKTVPIADPSRIGMWGHSNGGQIALTSLEISGKPYPTTLWAPVTKPFPYSILYFTDDIDDHGKALRKKTAEFEQLYDAELYSLTNYLDRITAPIQLHQGTADEAVPEKWSEDFVKECKMKNEKCKIFYYVYPGADHNMSGAWNTVVARDIEFFKRELKE